MLLGMSQRHIINMFEDALRGIQRYFELGFNERKIIFPRKIYLEKDKLCLLKAARKLSTFI